MPALRIAIRYLLARKSHTAVNIISYISMAGIAVAALAMVCVLSVFNGFSQLASDRLSLVNPDVKVTPVNTRVISDADSLAEELRGIPGVRVALPTLRGEALAIYNGRSSRSISVAFPTVSTKCRHWSRCSSTASRLQVSMASAERCSGSGLRCSSMPDRRQNGDCC